MLKLKLFFTLFTLISFVTTAAHALDLQSAKQQGLVGEIPNGYLGSVVNSGTVKSLVSSVNQQRKQTYLSISKQNSQPLNVVEALAAQKLYNKLNAGEYYQSASGEWKRK